MLNKYKIIGDTLIIYNRKDNREMLFDAEDFDLISKHTWCIHKNRKDNYEYVRTNIRQLNGKQTAKLASRLLMNEPIDKMVDHYNGNVLDNRKSNLRLATNQTNQHNRHNAKGYSFHKASQKWTAAIRINGKSKYLGLYTTEKEARSAYIEAKKKYHPTAPIHLYGDY